MCNRLRASTYGSLAIATAGIELAAQTQEAD